jgi:hypothetical protein
MGLQLTIRFLLILETIALTACNTVIDRLETAETIAQTTGMTKQVISAGKFVLTTYSKHQDEHTALLVIYIEGDGNAFLHKNYLSPDPTPKTPLALELASIDANPSVLYIARPCQYLTAEQLKTCDSKYWSTHRYSEEVVYAINQVVSQFATGYQQIGLVGYSGGGSIAVLLAARRQDISWLVTIGATLDHTYWTSLHDVTPLSGSLNPADFAESVQTLPQLHLLGEKDKIVPASVVHAYLGKATDTGKIHLQIIPGFNHQCCWVDVWPELLCESGNPDYCGK